MHATTLRDPLLEIASDGVRPFNSSGERKLSCQSQLSGTKRSSNRLVKNS